MILLWVCCCRAGSWLVNAVNSVGQEVSCAWVCLLACSDWLFGYLIYCYLVVDFAV